MATVAMAANNSTREKPEGVVLGPNRELPEMSMRILTFLVDRPASASTHRTEREAGHCDPRAPSVAEALARRSLMRPDARRNNVAVRI